MPDLARYMLHVTLAQVGAVYHFAGDVSRIPTEVIQDSGLVWEKAKAGDRKKSNRSW